jgi:hypothetical protein
MFGSKLLVQSDKLDKMAGLKSKDPMVSLEWSTSTSEEMDTFGVLMMRTRSTTDTESLPLSEEEPTGLKSKNLTSLILLSVLTDMSGARAAKKEEMSMMRDLQAVQGQALADEMKASGKSHQVNEQSYGDSYMKTAVLTTASIDEQMSTDASGEKKMQIGKGAQAAVATDDAVA